MNATNTVSALAAEIKAAMEDWLEHGSFTPHNPAIVRDGDGFSYESALNPNDGIVWDLQEGLGAWEPQEGDDLSALSEAAAEMVMSEIRDEEA